MAGIIMLLAAYVSSFYSACWLNNNMRGLDIKWSIEYVHAPLWAYGRSDLPGGAEFYASAVWFNMHGDASLKDIVRGVRQGRIAR